MLKPIGMTEGHYECRSLDETLPIFTELLAAEVIERTDKQAVVGRVAGCCGLKAGHAPSSFGRQKSGTSTERRETILDNPRL